MNFLLAQTVPTATPVPYQDIHPVLYWVPIIAVIVGVLAQLAVARFTIAAIRYKSNLDRSAFAVGKLTEAFEGLNQHLATLRDRIVRYEEHRAALAEVADDVSALALFFDAKEFYFTENLSADMEEIIKLSRKLRSGYQTYMSQGGDWEEFIEIRDDLLVRISNVRQKLIAQARCHLGVDKLTL